MARNRRRSFEEEDYYLLENNVLNLDEIVWSAILINKPIRVIHERAEEILAKQGITLTVPILTRT